ncbi:hypothetical protein HaLaN_26891 [Haematococcus lacustris]|uniref:Uncharacterized protein n=1 Tax=Haematococcus lacustris TaxID=44745 RepID=A0A6A0A7B6_HAELA|nr:hypothetical protein HaLaN_26891 [Haematococcus lacustris]
MHTNVEGDDSDKQAMASSASTASRKLSPRQATAVYAAGVLGFLLGLWALCAGLFAAVLGIAVEYRGASYLSTKESNMRRSPVPQYSEQPAFPWQLISAALGV